MWRLYYQPAFYSELYQSERNHVYKEIISGALSMFQPSLTHPDQTQPHKATSINRQSCRRSQYVRRSQFQTCSQSVGVSGAPPGQQLRFSSHASKEGSLRSMLERKNSVASLSSPFSYFMERSSQVRLKVNQLILRLYN